MEMLWQYSKRSLGQNALRQAVSFSLGFFMLKGLLWLALALWVLR